MVDQSTNDYESIYWFSFSLIPLSGLNVCLTDQGLAQNMFQSSIIQSKELTLVITLLPASPFKIVEQHRLVEI